jgi:DNA-directed RNA polymerase subunit RPC12/RpoP
MQVTQYRCSVCGMGFETEQELEQHQQQEHQTGGPRSYRCPSCNEEYSTEELLNAHMMSHR